MDKLNFCPYDGKVMDLRNLAYELVFAEGWDWNRVRTETVIGTDRKLYINEADTRRSHYDCQGESNAVILNENRTGGRNGLTLLCDYLRSGDPESDRNRYSREMPMYELPVYTNAHSAYNSPDDRPGRVFFEEVDEEYLFTDQFDSLIMKAVPCCPHCHRRLPDGWLTASDFIGMALIGLEGTGKTSYIDTLIRNNCEAFRNITGINGRILKMTPAADNVNGSAFIKASLTDRGDSRTVIIGIYDADNLLTEDGRIRADRAGNDILRRIDADVFMFDIRNMGISGIGQNKPAGRTAFIQCRLMSIEEQGRFQRQNAGRVISASDILSNRAPQDLAAMNKQTELTSDRIRQNSTGMLPVYEHVVAERMRYGRSELRSKQFIGVITKSDLIEDREKKGRYSVLFDRQHDRDMTDINSMLARSELVKELIHEYHMIDDNERRGYGMEYGKGSSWHCISSLGCDALTDGTLTGEYNPVRAAEPVMACFMRRIAENGWI